MYKYIFVIVVASVLILAGSASDNSDFVNKANTKEGKAWVEGTEPVNYWTYYSNQLYPNDTDWRVGIGTTSPDAYLRLQVVTAEDNHAAIGGFSSGNSGAGVVGVASSNGFAGVQGNGNGGNYGVYGYNADDYAVYASGDMGCSGNKTAVVRTSKGPIEMYAMESPEIWFEDFGEGILVGGIAHIELDPMFLEAVTINDSHPMKVFVQLNEDCYGTYVERGKTGFDVIELNNGRSNACFTYRALAKRKGYETERMKVVEVCYMDEFLYPDDNDPQIPSRWREKRLKRGKLTQN